MLKPACPDQLNTELQELSLLLGNRTFVDYFNIFLCLPVFGQHVFYNYIDAEFEFEPPIRERRHLYLDRREVLAWLYHERYRLFRNTSLYTEYSLCTNIRCTKVDLPGIKNDDENGEDRKTFSKNVMGTATGMMLFRESMRGTCGENVYRCWKDIEAWKQIEDPVKKMYWKYAIKTKYISQNSAAEVKGKIKLMVYRGILNFDLMPDTDIQEKLIDALLAEGSVQTVDSDDALLQLQTVLLDAMKTYWVPRHLVHIIKTAKKETLDILKRPAPGDLEYLSHERRLRCRFMFPTIYQESNISSPATTVLVSKSAGDISRTSVSTPSEEDDIYQEEEIGVQPKDLFSLWGGGPRKNIEVDQSSCSSSPSSIVEESPDDFIKRNLRSENFSVNKHVRSPIPIVLTSYLGGKKRTLLGRFPKTSNRVIWSLASDFLACCPFRSFLESNEQMMDLHYLSFWTDVRNYLDADESSVDNFGQPLRRLLAHRLVDKYLSRTGEGCAIFSETLKMSLFNAVANDNDVSLLCMAQDIVQAGLWEPLKLYIENERRHFVRQVRGYRYDIDMKKRKHVDTVAKQSIDSTGGNEAKVNPMYFFQCSTLSTEEDSMASESPQTFSPVSPGLPASSRPATSYHVCITEEQMWKAMEMSVLCCEYGTSMMLPKCSPKPEQLVDILLSDYGSLHVSRVPAVRNEMLKSLTNRPKINIETIRVSRKVYIEKIDLSYMKVKDPEKEEIAVKHKNRMVLRRNGMVVDRPRKPKSFVEVLNTAKHFDFFKRFIMVHKAGLPLMFWKSVEDLKHISTNKPREIRVKQIIRKFFGKNAKYGAMLDCHEEIIRQIPNMDKVTPGILICAQAAIYRSMERKWYPGYLDTYPPESESSGSPIHMPSNIPRNMTPEYIEEVNKSQKSKKKILDNFKRVMMWRNLTKTLVEFCRAADSRSEAQILEIFLKCEVEKEQTTSNIMPGQLQPIDKNIMMSNMASNVQTRVVIRNRLIILNRVPADLRFWVEVKKFQDLVDSANIKGNMSTQDTEFLCDKARSVISCYLSSDVSPKVQVNIPNDMALNIINSLASSGPQRGLFHEAIVLLFPLLYHYWRKFTDEWMNGDIPDEYMDTIEKTFKEKVSSTPHANAAIPDFKNVNEKDIKTSTQFMLDDNCVRIHFSILDGITFIYPQTRPHKSPAGGGRRMTKHSLHALNEMSSPRKESRLQVGDKRDSHTTKVGAGDKHDKHDVEKQTKQSEKEKKKHQKIIVKEPEQKRLSAPETNVKRSSNEKARRLSQLVESLNKEREQKIQEQNRRFSKTMNFEEVVSAAIKELSDKKSVFS